MIFNETHLKGLFLLQFEAHRDSRGFFARSYCYREFSQAGLNPRIAQCNVSYNIARGTLRGMHYQTAPYKEAKLVRCTAGAIYDVAIDLRKDSKTYSQYFGIQLNPKNGKMIYIPEDFAHGFITLENDTEVFYQMSEFYAPEYARGFRWNDPAFQIDWPLEPVVISDRDKSYPDYIQDI